PLPSSSSLPTTSTSEIYTLSLHDALPIFGGHSDLDANARFRLKWSVYWYDKPLNDHLVLYESFDGNGALCNPRAIFDELLDTEDMTHLSHIWCFATVAIKREFDRKFATHPRVSSVLRGTIEYYRALSTAKYLVNNAT